MRPTKVYILEDELVTQLLLKGYLEDFGYEVCGMADNAQTARTEIPTVQPDIAILDIHVKGEHDGIWLSEQLAIPFIFLTAYIDQGTLHRALKNRPSAYLVKPFENNQVYAAIELALLQSSTVFNPPSEEGGTFVESESELSAASEPIPTKPYKQLYIKDGHLHYKVNNSEIEFLKADGKYIEIHTTSKRLIMRTSLVNFLKQHEPWPFIRVHKSYAINRDKVIAFSSSAIRLPKREIPLSRSYKKTFLTQVAGTL